MLKKIKRYWQNRFLLVILLVFCLGIAGTFLSMVTTTQNFIEEEAIRTAQQTTQALFGPGFVRQQSGATPAVNPQYQHYPRLRTIPRQHSRPGYLFN